MTATIGTLLLAVVVPLAYQPVNQCSIESFANVCQILIRVEAWTCGIAMGSLMCGATLGWGAVLAALMHTTVDWQAQLLGHWHLFAYPFFSTWLGMLFVGIQMAIRFLIILDDMYVLAGMVIPLLIGTIFINNLFWLRLISFADSEAAGLTKTMVWALGWFGFGGIYMPAPYP